MRSEIIRIWEREKMTILFVTHDVDEAVQLADRIVVLTARPGTGRPRTGCTSCSGSRTPSDRFPGGAAGRGWRDYSAMQLPSIPILTFLFCLAPTASAQEGGEEEQVERGLRVRAAGAFEGYTLISPLQSHSVYLLDMDGEVVHEWKTGAQPAGGFYLLDDGRLLRAAAQKDVPIFHGGGIGGRIQELDWQGKLLWDYVLADEFQTQHHDLEPLPNGNVLAIVWEHRYAEDAVEWGRDPGTLNDEGFWPDAVVEIRPERPEGGEIVWEWHSWDHVIQDLFPDKRNHGSPADHPERIDLNADHRDRPASTEEEKRRQAQLAEQMRELGYVGGDEEEEEVGEADGDGPPQGGDWLHTNGIDYHPEYDLIVLSTPHMSELWVIDHSTSTEEAAWSSGGRWGKGGDLLYRWGNPRNYGAGDRKAQRLFYQHHPIWLPGERPGELRLLVFNNGGGRPGGDFSSVDELVLPFDPEKGFLREKGAAFGPAEPAWSYSDGERFFSGFISGAERLPNGNTLICQGAAGRVFEVTRGGEIVWEYWNELGGEVAPNPQGGNAPPQALFRATRIAKDHPGIADRF